MADGRARCRWWRWLLAIGPLLLVLLVVPGGSPAVAGIALRAVESPAAARLAWERLEAADRRELHARLAARQLRLEHERQVAATVLREAEARLSGLMAALAELGAERQRQEAATQVLQAELSTLQARVESLLAEIVQLSRDETGEPRRLAQLRAVVASLAQPFASGKAAFLESRQALAGLDARGDALRAASLEAHRALAEGRALEQRLAASGNELRHAVTQASARADAAMAMAATTERRLAGLRASRGLAVVRPGHRAGPERLAAAMRDSRQQPARLAPPTLRAHAVLTADRARAALPLALPRSTVLAQRLGIGQLLPVAGAVVDRFGEGRAPLFDRGLMLEVETRGPVRAPHDGQVVFARAYADFGLLLIIDHGDEYHSLLSGLSRLVVGEGAWVRTGQMVGTLEPMAGRSARLYLELRRSGIPVDPLTWLAAGQDKVRS